MAEKNRSKIRDYLVYLAVRIVVCVLQALSFEMACAFGRFLGWLAYKVDRRHRLVAIENLQKAFPGQYNDAEIDCPGARRLPAFSHGADGDHVPAPASAHQ